MWLFRTLLARVKYSSFCICALNAKSCHIWSKTSCYVALPRDRVYINAFVFVTVFVFVFVYLYLYLYLHLCCKSSSYDALPRYRVYINALPRVSHSLKGVVQASPKGIEVE